MPLFRKLVTNMTGGEYSPPAQARVDLEAFQKGMKKLLNVIIHPHGGVSNRSGFEMLSYTRQGGLTVQIPFIADIETDATYQILLSNTKMMFTRDGNPVLEAEVSGFTVSDQSGTARFNKTAHGFVDGDYIVFVDDTNVNLGSRMFEVDYLDADNFELMDVVTGVKVTYVNVTGSGYTMRRRYTVTVPYVEGELRQVVFAQDNDIMYLTHGNHPLAKLSRYGDTDWRYEVIDFTPKTLAPTGLSVTALTGTGYDATYATTYNYKVAAIDADSGEEGLPSASVSINNDLAIQGAKNTLTWTGVTNAEKYVVYKDTQGVYGYIGSADGTTFIDDNLAEDEQDGPQQDINPFSTSGEYPRSCALHEQRLACGSLAEDPQVIHLSKSTLLENFSYASPAKADDAISFRVKDKSRQHIYAIITLPEGLALFTSTAEWIVRGGNEEGYLTPTNPLPRPQSRRGSYWLQPLMVGDMILYAQARGGVIRDFEYNLEKNRFAGEDRTIMARHLFDHKKIVSWCYAQSPYSIIWVVMDTGELYAFTFMREHNVWGWAPQDIDGFVEDVSTTPEDDDDTIYITIKRDINGNETRFHERMRPRRMSTRDDWFFVDCGLQYKGTPTRYVYGLWHLEGEEVVALADGNVIAPQTVTNGRIDLGEDAEYGNVAVGLGYQSEGETLPIDLGVIPDLGSVSGRNVSIGEVYANVVDSRGLWIGRDRDNLTEVVERQLENWDEPIEAFTGRREVDAEIDTGPDATITFMQKDPLPMTLTSLAIDIHVGG